jgi:hypothetical protein
MDFATGQFPQGLGQTGEVVRRSYSAWRVRFRPPEDRTVFKEPKKSDWAVVAICLAVAVLSLGIYSVKLAIAYRADHPALPGKNYGKSGS